MEEAHPVRAVRQPSLSGRGHDADHQPLFSEDQEETVKAKEF